MSHIIQRQEVQARVTAVATAYQSSHTALGHGFYQSNHFAMVDKILKGQHLPESWSGLSMLVMLSEACQRYQLCGHAYTIMRVRVKPGGRQEGNALSPHDSLTYDLTEFWERI